MFKKTKERRLSFFKTFIAGRAFSYILFVYRSGGMYVTVAYRSSDDSSTPSAAQDMPASRIAFKL